MLFIPIFWFYLQIFLSFTLILFYFSFYLFFLDLNIFSIIPFGSEQIYPSATKRIAASHTVQSDDWKPEEKWENKFDS